MLPAALLALCAVGAVAIVDNRPIIGILSAPNDNGPQVGLSRGEARWFDVESCPAPPPPFPHPSSLASPTSPRRM